MSIERLSTLPPLPVRPIEGHKGIFGRVLIVGGNEAMVGAPVLAGTSALRMGAGLVQIAVPKGILAAALSITPELIGLGLRRSKHKELLLAAGAADAVVIGPGMGKSAEAADRLAHLLKLDKPIVIDADALNLLATGKRWPTSVKARAVLTPHPGEMKRLAKLIRRTEVPNDDDGRIEIAVAASNAFKQIVVLKGHRTVVTDGARVYVNRSGDSTLSKAGTGDVLSGIIGALLGQKMAPFESACAGVHLHGHAGEIAGEKFGKRSTLAREIIDAIPQAIAQYERENG